MLRNALRLNHIFSIFSEMQEIPEDEEWIISSSMNEINPALCNPFLLRVDNPNI